MKKIITVLALVAVILTVLGVTVASESYIDKYPSTCEYEVTVKKADPSVVKKDGIIDLEGGEYVKATVPLGELSVNFKTSASYMYCDEMAHTIEYYFSWDDDHGFNFAVKYDAGEGFNTNIPAGTGEIPCDDFMANVGLNFVSGAHKTIEGSPLLYYSIAKTIGTEDGYLTGHWNQLGNSGAYAAVGGQDFEVSYPGGTTVIFEWSVPFAEILDVPPTDGVSFGFTLSASAGKETAEGTNSNFWSVALGQTGGWLVQNSIDNSYATAQLSNDPVIPSENLPDHECEYYVTESVEPVSCNSPGYEIYTCTVCGDRKYQEVVGEHIDEDNDGYCDVCQEHLEYTLVLDTVLSVEVFNDGTNVYVGFVPEASGVYTFTSYGTRDVVGILYDSDKFQIAFNDDDGEYGNFKITYNLEKGKKYYLSTRYYYNDTGIIDVSVTCNKVFCEHINTTDVPGVSGTCSLPGYTEGVFCNDCGEWASGHEIVRILHTDGDGDKQIRR